MNDSADDDERFLATLIRSGLVPVARLTEVRSAPVGLADRLVASGELTPFQARKLKAGAFHGLVLGPYHVLVPIGRGGMGTVYLARDSRDQSLAAVKVLPPKKAKAEERMLARFQREMHFSEHVDHPALTRTFETGVQGVVHYIAMEFIPGRSLFRLVNDDGPIPAGRAARLFLQVAEGLHYAHSRGLVHRDLKPSNIMVTPDDSARILDLGLALLAGEEVTDAAVIGGQGYIVGSMDYIAPEQTTDASAVDAQADLYSLGCTMYFALTGQPPFPGGDRKQKMERHRNEAPQPIEDRNPALPRGLAVLVHRLLQKEPDRRPASAKEVSELLQPYADAPPQRPDPANQPIAWADLEAHSAEFEVVEETPAASNREPLSLSWLVGLGGIVGFAAAVAAYWLIRAAFFRR